MKKKTIPLKVGRDYTLYTYSEISQTAHKVELTILNVFPEPVSIPDSVEKRVAIGTAKIRGSEMPISVQVKTHEDIIVPEWNQMGIETILDGICFTEELEACFRLMLANVNPFVENHDHCYYRGSSMKQPELIFPLGKKNNDLM